jgi:hypothetical protein
MPLFDERTPAQVVADAVIAQLERDFRQRVILNKLFLDQIFNNPTVSQDDVIAAFGDKADAILQYLSDTADFINTRQTGAVPVTTLGGVLTQRQQLQQQAHA